MNLEIYILKFLNYNNILFISLAYFMGVFIFSSIVSFVNTSFLNKNLVSVFSIYNYIFLISLIFIYAFFGIQIELTRSCTLFEYFFLSDHSSLLSQSLAFYITFLCIFYSSRLFAFSIRSVLSGAFVRGIFICFTCFILQKSFFSFRKSTLLSIGSVINETIYLCLLRTSDFPRIPNMFSLPFFFSFLAFLITSIKPILSFCEVTFRKKYY